MERQIFFLLAPESAVVCLQFRDGFADQFGAGGGLANFEAFEEFNVAFFLSRDDVMHQHGTLGGEGFVNGGSAGLANDEMMRAEEIGDFFSPSLEGDAMGEFLFDFVCLAVEASEVVAQDHGDFTIAFEDSAHDFSHMR